MTNVIRTGVALMLVTIMSATLMGSVSAAPPANHGSGKDRQGYCQVASGQYEPCLPGTNGTEPEQSHGNFLYGTPGEDRRAAPEQSDEPGCTAASALNSNPSQAAGDNVGYPNEHAADQADGGPFGRCFG